ncbi:MAG: hypothetical protein WCW53_05025 [Syntrophales bacterium]|jgi:hypothetical protein
MLPLGLLKWLNAVFVVLAFVYVLFLYWRCAQGDALSEANTKSEPLYIVVTHRQVPYLKIPWKKKTYRVGRTDDCDIVLKHCHALPLDIGMLSYRNGQYIFAATAGGERHVLTIDNSAGIALGDYRVGISQGKNGAAA